MLQKFNLVLNVGHVQANKIRIKSLNCSISRMCLILNIMKNITFVDNFTSGKAENTPDFYSLSFANIYT